MKLNDPLAEKLDRLFLPNTTARRRKNFRSIALIAAISSSSAISACSGEVSVDEEPVVREKGSLLTLAQHEDVCESDPRVVSGLVPLEVCVGANIFFRETFDGNGRTCSSCHRAERNFTIDPEFISTLPPDDPLFVAELDPALAELEIPNQMRERSLILENVDGFDPDPTEHFVLRSVPHNLSMSTSILTPSGEPTPPNHRTGWSGDGAPFDGRLADFTSGAIRQHFTQSLDRVPGEDFRFATEEEGQAVALFMEELGRKNEIDLNSTPFSDSGSEQGRQRFLAVGCNGCHDNAGANASFGDMRNRNFDTGVEDARNSALAGFPPDGGFGASPENADGSFGDETFNSTPLIEAADTPPFFHTDTVVEGAPAFNTDSATTIEEATAFYATDAFANAQGNALDLSAADIENIGRFLRGLNAVFNIQLASERVLGARELGNSFGNTEMDVQNRILQLARVEVNDALEVLQEAPGSTLNPSAQNRLVEARNHIDTALGSTEFGVRMQAMGDAFNRLDLADGDISANIQFDMGTGNLMD